MPVFCIRNGLLAIALSVTCGFCSVTIKAEDSASAGLDRSASGSQKVIAEAERILSQVKETSYSHKTSVDEAAGAYHLDCSGLACLVLKKTAPAALKEVPVNGGEKRALAHDFYELFKNPASTAHWKAVEKLKDLQPGDFIAWKNEDYQPGENTGHVMIVAVAPVVEKGVIYQVTVIDSSGSGHGQDTRKPGENGVGKGTLYFTVDSEGVPVGVRFTSPAGKLNKKLITLGRLVDSAR